jgi:16S rRNA (adenine1518-N6/adenine1519-N6)-dimethyltransferase
MAQTKKEIQSLLSGASTSPRHRFGQNFMIDQNLVRLVAAAGQIAVGDVAIEVGPGTGTLTEELLASPAARVVTVEIDRDLAALLRDRFGGNERFQLIEGDALDGKHAVNAELLSIIRAVPGGVKLVANLPYNIASPLVIELLLAGVQTLAFTVQKEVADRLRAGAGADAYGPLSVMAQMLSRVEVLRTLSPQAFWPAPKIESALVRMTRNDRLGEHAAAFGAFVRKIFSARRKTLRKAMAMAGWPAEAVLGAAGLNGQQRPEEFSPEQLWLLFNTLLTFAPPAPGSVLVPSPGTADRRSPGEG